MTSLGQAGNGQTGMWVEGGKDICHMWQNDEYGKALDDEDGKHHAAFNEISGQSRKKGGQFPPTRGHAEEVNEASDDDVQARIQTRGLAQIV
jgi:hypothetical protein